MSETEKEVESEEVPAKYPLQIIRGLPFPAPYLSKELVEKAIDFKPDDSDIFVVTYPKCGTTWAQFLVWEILHKGADPPSPNQMMFKYFPFLEFFDVDMLKDLPPPRTMKTHLPFHLQPYNPSSKYIYIVRNPWDCCVSYYYHHKIDPSMPQLTFDAYFELFLTGELGWGDYLDHALSWYKHKNDSNILFLTYENMKKDSKRALLQIARFLGDTYYEYLQNEEILQNCLKHSHFKYLKEMGMFFPKAPSHGSTAMSRKEIIKQLGDVDRNKADPALFQETDFFRKGEVGDWKNHFSQGHIKRFNEYMMQKLKGTEMEHYWPLLEEETSL